MKEAAFGAPFSATTADATGFSFPDVGGVLETVTSGFSKVAGTLLDVQKNRDALVNAREDQQFKNYLRSVDLDTARTKASISSQVELTRAQSVLAQAQAALNPKTFRWDIALGVVAAAVGAFAVFRLARGGR